MDILLSSEVGYVLLIFGLFFVAKFLQRFRIPGAITCLALGVILGMGFGAFQSDPVVNVFAILGIAILFLFAGMEIEVDILRREARALLGHIAVQGAGIALVAWLTVQHLHLEWRASLLVALALMSPSAGFILDSLEKLEVSEPERRWIKSRAIATEIVAMLVLLFTLQSTSPSQLGITLSVLIGMILFLPLVFRFFASVLLPHAPKTEFAFLVVVALICAAVTKKLGVYYLVGAFVVGITEQYLRKKIPSLETGRVLTAVELFASFFVPFYFFKAGLGLHQENFTVQSLMLGGFFLVTIVPLRIALVATYRWGLIHQPFRQGIRLGVSILPTLVFTLVLSEILRERFNASPTLIGALVIYTLVNTIVPAFVLRLPPGQYESPEPPPPIYNHKPSV
jgi:Kef-type K+ transport system membrane component KefB